MSNQNVMAQPGIGSGEKPTKQRLLIVALLFIGLGIAYLGRMNVSVLAVNDQFLTEMGIKGQPIQIGMMMTAFLIAYGIGNIVLSPLGDYLGPRKAMCLWVAVGGAGMLMGGFAGSFMLIIAARALLGFSQGGYYPLQPLFVKNWFPAQERGRANATWVISQSLFSAAAMPLFTFVIGDFGWRASFWLCVVLSVIFMYALWFHTADTPRKSNKVNALELKHIEKGSADEQKVKATSTQESFWQQVKTFAGNYRYWLLVYWYVALAIMYWGLAMWLPSYLKMARGFSWAEMGWLASLPYLFGIVTKAFTGWIVDRTGKSGPIQFAAMLLGSLSIYFAATVTGKYESAIFIICAMGFTTMGTPALWTVLPKIVPNKAFSTASGLVSGIGTGFAGGLSPMLIGVVISMTGSYDGGLFFLVGVGVLATMAGAVFLVQKY